MTIVMQAHHRALIAQPGCTGPWSLQRALIRPVTGCPGPLTDTTWCAGFMTGPATFPTWPLSVTDTTGWFMKAAASWCAPMTVAFLRFRHRLDSNAYRTGPT